MRATTMWLTYSSRFYLSLPLGIESVDGVLWSTLLGLAGERRVPTLWIIGSALIWPLQRIHEGEAGCGPPPFPAPARPTPETSAGTRSPPTSSRQRENSWLHTRAAH